MKLAKSSVRGAETSVLLATTDAGCSSGGYWVDGQSLAGMPGISGLIQAQDFLGYGESG